MRDFIDILNEWLCEAIEENEVMTEGIAMQYTGKYADKSYPIYQNANAAVFQKLERETKFGVRGLIDVRSGYLYFWDAYAAVHFAIKNELGIVDAIHLNMWPDSVVILSPRGAHQTPMGEDQINGVMNNRYIKRIYGTTPEVNVEGIN